MAVAILCVCEILFYEVKGHTWAFPIPFTDQKSVKKLADIIDFKKSCPLKNLLILSFAHIIMVMQKLSPFINYHVQMDIGITMQQSRSKSDNK